MNGHSPGGLALDHSVVAPLKLYADHDPDGLPTNGSIMADGTSTAPKAEPYIHSEELPDQADGSLPGKVSSQQSEALSDQSIKRRPPLGSLKLPNRPNARPATEAKQDWAREERKERRFMNGGHDSSAVEAGGLPGKDATRGTETLAAGESHPPVTGDRGKDKVLRLSSTELEELTSSPESLALRRTNHTPRPLQNPASIGRLSAHTDQRRGHAKSLGDAAATGVPSPSTPSVFDTESASSDVGRPGPSPRAISTPQLTRRRNSSSRLNATAQPSSLSRSTRAAPSPLPLESSNHSNVLGSAGPRSQVAPDPSPSPMPPTIPLPPLSFPTYLQLELSSSRPSPLYIHRSAARDYPYESSQIKFERLLNFLLLPPQLEGVLWFGALACLDAWLYTFTILPLRFVKALGLLCHWWGLNLAKEVTEITTFIFSGAGRVWQRWHVGLVSGTMSASPLEASRSRGVSGSVKTPSNRRVSPIPPNETGSPTLTQIHADRRHHRTSRRHRQTKTTPSTLSPGHKADLLKGCLVLFSCLVLMRFDASRMYHGIRGQAAIKLYVIYNVLEVCDRLFSALGQDVLECLFSRETLERNADGRSKILRPFGMFLLALAYSVIHSTALFYQVITLNVAVNSYSNALLTLLMSNQFVEIKSTVFKKFEKENLFQLTCADVVERFQLWLMLLIIAMRNLVEVGGLTMASSSSTFGSSSGLNGNSTNPMGSGAIIPKSFTILPEWTGQVLGPFMLVLGSEMLVDWLKHAYVTKFNSTKPAIYGRFLDVLAKDYYSDAFSDQNLTRRLGLPVIPLSCLFIRASLQTYHMFLASTMPLPLPASSTSLTDTSTSTPVATAALAHFDAIVRRALGRSSFGAGSTTTSSTPYTYTFDDVIALLTTFTFFLATFLILLGLKLVLGMILLSFARSRYRSMKEREQHLEMDTAGRRVGGWGTVEVDEDKKRWIYADDPDGARTWKERERVRERAGELSASAAQRGGDKAAEKGEKKAPPSFGAVSRYAMVAKRIW
ncbi:MAG: hypothetical protein M1838_000683 [Thelocarpon superellum]|nr:MAG: hypothetical protein M1838_000683 [Thelocarpon superellum]